MMKVSKVRILAAVFLLASVLAIALTAVPFASAVSPGPCVYTGHAFVDGAAVPDGTGIRVLKDSTVLGNTTTGPGAMDANEYYLDGIITLPGTEVNFEVWHEALGEWASANETAIHEMYGIVNVDLYAEAPPLHINVDPFLFVYPWPDCTLPEALSNIGPPSDGYPDALDVVVIVWGTAEVGDEWRWVSYNPDTGGGDLGGIGLEQGKPYVMQVTGEGVCNDWEMYISE